MKTPIVGFLSAGIAPAPIRRAGVPDFIASRHNRVTPVGKPSRLENREANKRLLGMGVAVVDTNRREGRTLTGTIIKLDYRSIATSGSNYNCQGVGSGWVWNVPPAMP